MEITVREKQVLNLVKEGIPYKMIANGLGIAHCTVRMHVKFAMARLGASNATHAVVIAIRKGYIDLGGQNEKR